MPQETLKPDQFSFGECRVCNSVSLALKNGVCRKCATLSEKSMDTGSMDIFKTIFGSGFSQ